MMSVTTVDSAQQSKQETLLYLEKTGTRYTNEIAQAVKQIPWLIKSLQLFWTAGPVTYIALQGGYYLSYGRLAPWEIFVYFAGYTMIAGLIGIAATISYRVFYSPKEESAAKTLTNVISKLTDFTAHLRDLKISDLELDYRKLESARMILESTHPDPEAIRLATLDITGDHFFADKCTEIELYRRLGLQARIKDCYDEIKEKAEHFVPSLSVEHPHLSELLERRLKGDSPTLQEGLPRNPHFLRRLLLASEEENELLITPRDIEEILILSLELLAGRAFTVLTFRYKGRKKLNDAHDNLEQARDAYHLTLTSFRSRIKALYVYLASLENSQIDFVPCGSSIDEQIRQCHVGLESLYHSLKEEWMRVKQSRYRKNRKLARQLQSFKHALNIYRRAYAQMRRIKGKKNHFKAAIKEWERLSNKFCTNESGLFSSRKGLGELKVQEKTICLNDEEKIELAYKVQDLLEPFIAFSESNGKQSTDIKKQVELDDFKTLGIDIAIALSDMLPIDNPLIQYSIENSSAANLLSIEVGISAQTKVGFLSAIVNELTDNVSQVAAGFAKALVELYGISLNDQVIAFLGETYDIDLHTINSLKETTTKHEVTPVYLSDWDETSLSELPKHWLKLMHRVDDLIH